MDKASLVGRAVAALLLTIGFYALALALAATLLFLTWQSVGVHHVTNVNLVVALVGGAGVILWSVLPRRERFVAPGLRITQHDQPRLVAWIESVAAAAGEPMPDEIYLAPVANAFVKSRGGLLGIGSRRVLCIGLPLMAFETKGELATTIAHEFGHFRGGDVALGPWIHATRSAILRAVRDLGERSVLRMPFVWYAHLFLRVTLAISRRQELHADALGIKVGGTDAHCAALRKVHSLGALFGVFFRDELQLALERKLVPPMTEGYAAFLAVKGPAAAAAALLERRLGGEKHDPYDTHPTLSERLEWAAKRPRVEQRADSVPAWRLVDDLRGTEIGALHATGVLRRTRRAEGRGGGNGGKRATSPKGGEPVRIEWSEVGARVVLPFWREQATALHHYLPETATVGDLPRLLECAQELGRKVHYMRDPAECVAMGLRTLYCALCDALARDGFELHAALGERLTMRRGETLLAPGELLEELLRDPVARKEWPARIARSLDPATPLLP